MSKAKGITATAAKDKRTKAFLLVATLLLTAVFAVLAVVASGALDGSGSKRIEKTLSTGSNTVDISGSKELYYKFECTSDGTYTFVSSNLSSNADPYATLYDSTWYSLRTDDNSAGSRNFSISYSLDSGKTYYLGIKQSYSGNSLNGVSSLTLTVNKDSSWGSDSADKITSGTLTVGSNYLTLSSSSEVYYSFRPSTSGTYTFTSFATSGIDPQATLYSSSWSSLKSDDDGGDGNNFSLSYSLNSGNTYYLGVQLVSGSSSGKTLTVNVSSGSSSSDKTVSGSLSASSSTSVTLSGTNEVYYSFRPTSSGSYTFTCTGATSSVYPVATLYGSGWSQLQTSTNSSSNRNFTLTYSLTSGTTYYIGIKFSSNSTSTRSKTFTVSVSK